jgi:hypothetical protein
MTGKGKDMSTDCYFRWTKVKKCDIFKIIKKIIIIKRPKLSAISTSFFAKKI